MPEEFINAELLLTLTGETFKECLNQLEQCLNARSHALRGNTGIEALPRG